MTPIKYGKLVRDKIPEIIKADGYTPVFSYYGMEPYRQALTAKLIEEVGEFVGSADISELVDIYEVVLCLAKEKGVDKTEFMEMVESKREARGSFASGVFLSAIAVAETKP